jgi:NACalpha-BTF3-like transcription factor
MLYDQQDYFKLLKKTFMNVKNLEFLKEGLKYLGFGDKLNADLEGKIKEQPLEFKLNLVGEFNKDNIKDRVNYTLDFKKSDQSDMYFLNRYLATLKNEDPKQEKSQTFYITKNSGVTAKEAYNLLSGRAVNKDLTNKEGQPYNAWLQLDFQEKDKNDNYKVKQYHQGYGYDLEMVTSKYPIKEQLNPEDKTKMMKSLEKGNLTQVTFAREGGEDKMFIAANPQYKTLDLYNAKLEKQYQGIEKKEKQGEDKSQEKKETQKQNVDEEGEAKKGKKSSKRKGIGV